MTSKKNRERKMNFFVYILAGKDSKPIHVGLTDDLMRDVYENISKDERESGVKLKRLLHYEVFDNPEKAELRRNQLKKSLFKNTN